MAQRPQELSGVPSQSLRAAESQAVRRNAADVASLIARIKRLIASDPNIDGAELTRVADDYDALNKDTVRRLSKCCAALTAGNTDTGIELAEASPALPDVIQALKFLESSTWNALLARSKRAPAPPFNPRQIKQLEDAYANPATLNALRRACQGLHEAGMAIHEQLAAARRLRLLDRGNAECVTWLAALEAQRQGEIRALTSAPGKLTLEEADALLEELSDSRLLVLPPLDLIEAAKKVRAEIRHRTIAATLTGLLALLPEAYAKRDLTTVDKVVEQIGKLTDAGDVPPTELAAIELAREWLSTENEAFYTQLHEMEMLLDDLADSKHVRDQVHVIEEFKRPMPPILHQRTMSYLDYHEVSEQRRGRLFKFVLLLFLIQIGAVVAWWLIKNRT